MANAIDVIADPDFQRLPPDRQSEVLRRLGIVAQEGEANAIAGAQERAMAPRDVGPGEMVDSRAAMAKGMLGTAPDPTVGEGVRSLAVPATALGGGNILPFLLRLGTGQAAAAGAAGSALPAAAKAVQSGPGQTALKAADQSTSLIVQQLRQIASRDSASYLAAKQIAKEMGEEGKQIWELVKSARPTHRVGVK